MMTTCVTILAALLALPQAPPTERPVDPPALPPVREGDRPPPSLDDALGIGGTRPPQSPARRGEEDPELQRSLDGAKPRDILASAIEDMRRSTRLLESSEAGIDTRRVQESVVRKLDELIASAQRMKDQQPQQQGARQQQQQQQQQGRKPEGSNRDREGAPEEPPEAGQPRGGQDPPRQQGASRRPDGDADANEPPEAVDPTMQDAQFDESRSEWGRLPPRVREAVRQGLRDPMSAAYRRLTQEYYRRLAEDPRR